MTAADPLEGRAAIVCGASRGIGLDIARMLARAGANIALIAKTDVPNPKLSGTIHDAAEELRALGADVLPIRSHPISQRARHLRAHTLSRDCAPVSR